MDRNENEINDLVIELAEMLRDEAFFAISINGSRYSAKVIGYSGDISDAVASAMFADPEVAEMITDSVQKYRNALN
jgi:predicted amino acid dehydrogenase